MNGEEVIKAVLFFNEVQRFVDFCITKLNDEEINNNESIIIENFESQNELFSYHLQRVIFDYVRDYFGTFSKELKNTYDESMVSRPYVSFNIVSSNMILENLGYNPSNSMYYIAFAQIAILKNLYKTYFYAFGWHPIWIIKIIIDAMFDGVLKENYDRIRKFGLSFIKTVFEIQGCSMGRFSNCYSEIPVWNKNTLPRFVQVEDSKDTDSWKEFEKNKCFIAFTDSEIRSTMHGMCMEMASRYSHDNPLFRYIATALYLAKYLVKIEITGVDYASDAISRWIESSKIVELESTHYDKSASSAK